MKRTLFGYLLLPISLLCLFMATRLPTDVTPIGMGKHPAISADGAGTVHVVFGRGKTVLYTVSVDNGQVFSEPTRIDSLAGLHLGASRGPQIAATRQFVVITVIDKPGNVWSYSLDRSTGKWAKHKRVNDVGEVAKEGFVSLAAGADGTFHALWLDLRGNEQNKLVGASSTDGGHTWSANKVLYQSPEGTVCECCQPTLVANGAHVAVLFRNYIAGARNMYMLTSADYGKTFGPAQKLGTGNWPLQACPMDGGGAYISPSGQVATVWRREDQLYTSAATGPETLLGAGKLGKVAVTPAGQYYVWQVNGQLWTKTPQHSQPQSLGTGGYAKLSALSNDRVLCIWEQDNQIVRQFIE